MVAYIDFIGSKSFFDNYPGDAYDRIQQTRDYCESLWNYNINRNVYFYSHNKSVDDSNYSTNDYTRRAQLMDNDLQSWAPYSSSSAIIVCDWWGEDWLGTAGSSCKNGVAGTGDCRVAAADFICEGNDDADICPYTDESTDFPGGASNIACHELNHLWSAEHSDRTISSNNNATIMYAANTDQSCSGDYEVDLISSEFSTCTMDKIHCHYDEHINDDPNPC